MRRNSFLITIFVAIWIMCSKGFAQNTSSATNAQILIYQNGSVISINPNSRKITATTQFSTAFMPNSNLSALWAEYDKNRNRLYMIVEREPWDPKTGKQLRSVVALDLTTSKEEILYTDYYLVGAAISPNGTKLLIHQYKVGNHSIMPMASQVCVLEILTKSCTIIEIKGIASQFEWINESEFVTPALGVLYLCFVEQTSCQGEENLKDIYVDRIIKSDFVNQLVIAGQITPYDGTVHYFYFGVDNHQRTELMQLRKTPIYNADNLAVIQDAIGYMKLSANGKYLITTNQLEASKINVLDLPTGTLVATFQGLNPQWVGDSNLLVDTIVEKDNAEVFTLDVETGKKTTLYTTNQPFNLIVP